MKKPASNVIGFLPVVAALVGNFLVTLMKFAGFLISGSSVLFSETVHSFADTLNQSLLLVGIKRSLKKPTEKFAYGFGQERFFWALISACGIFFVGAGVTIYHGISYLAHGKALIFSPLIFVILAGVFIIESITFWLAIKELKKRNPDKNFKEALKDGDPSTLAVFYEDGVALLGVIIAFLSILLSRLTGKFYWDAAGSICIGVLLAVFAIILIKKNREFLLTKSISEEFKERVIEILETDSVIEKVYDFKSSVIDIGVYRIKCEVEFNGPALLKEMGRNDFFKNEYEEVKNDYKKFLKFCVDYADRVPRLMGQRINKIEEKIQKEFPGIKHIDIEIN